MKPALRIYVGSFGNMLITLWLAVGLSVLVLDVVHASDEEQPTYLYKEILDENKISDLRKSRSSPGRRIAAFLRSAVEVSTKSKKFRRFVKQGSVSDAVEDFNQLNPTNVRKRRYSTDAFVGDAHVKLQRLDRGQYDQPTIEITYPQGIASFKIVYTKDDI